MQPPDHHWQQHHVLWVQVGLLLLSLARGGLLVRPGRVGGEGDGEGKGGGDHSLVKDLSTGFI